MNKIKFICFICIMYISTGYAHDADKAFFDIIPEEKHTVVYAEFPWTIRNALITFDSNYVNLKTIEDVNKVFFKYSQEKLKLYSNGNELKLLDVVLNKDLEHSHSTKYKLIFDGVDVAKVNNTMMIEHNDNQMNYHFFTDVSGEDKRIVTNKKAPIFDLKLKEDSINILYYILGSIFVVLSLVFIFIKRKV